METSSTSSRSSFEGSEISIGTHDNVKTSVQDPAPAVVTGNIKTGEGIEHLEAHFNSQQERQSSSSDRGEVRNDIGTALDEFAVSGSGHAGASSAGAGDDRRSLVMGRLQEAETNLE